MLRGMATINIWADDVEEAGRWYAEFLGIQAYFRRSNPDGTTAYLEFRVGDYEHELGIIDSRYAPTRTAPGGAVTHWHVDDLEAAVARLLSLGAKEHMPVTEHGEGFVTASVVDPFGNVLGVMRNVHYLEILERTGPA
ncbi:VOC family protein [Actinomadura kijaniata]|uniref:VOC family protein n=1 Tax=Actinomadura kijaniata TaxID=46161 RepID=UPI00082B0B2F|nr:VOC family protein [Actinomadura kijaniata]